MKKTIFSLPLIILSFYSCSQSSRKLTEKLEKVFVENTVIDGYKFSKEEIGEIKIYSGKIIACDPFISNEATPFSINFPIGNFPVELAIAKNAGDERIAYARILFSKNKVVQWEMAMIEGSDGRLSKDEIEGYGIDSGIGSFIDVKTFTKLDSISRIDSTVYSDLMSKWNKSYKPTRGWCIYTIEDKNFVIFSSGFGDGVYQTFIGYDKDRNICCLLTDFNILR